MDSDAYWFMAKIIPTFQKMFSEGIIPLKDGVWIDIYNQSVNTEISGTIHTRISQGNYWYVTEVEDTPSDRERLH